jgi:hypothetical protein
MPASDILTTGAVRAGDQVDLLVTIKPREDQNRPDPMAPPGPAGTPVAPQATPTPAADIEIGTTQMTMQNLKILAIGAVLPSTTATDKVDEKTKGNASQAPTGPQSLITFAVDRQDALTLKALKDDPDRVKLEVVLRGAGDQEVAKTDPVTLSTIMDRYQFRAVPTPRAQAEARR